MSKKPLSHYSPVFANKPWANEAGYISYYRDVHQKRIGSKPQGKKQWGRQRGLYSWKLEEALNTELETEAAKVYGKLLSYQELDFEQRTLWAQFLLSQLVRTPTFLRYEQAVRNALGIQHTPEHDRIGCKECGDLVWITCRDWALLQAHEDDYFVRTDNPVLLSGFVERPQTCLVYPLSPRLCFAACSMRPDWTPWVCGEKHLGLVGSQLAKGDAHFINFQLAKAADDSLIISPQHDGLLASTMFGDMLGAYPQPPFSLHSPSQNEIPDAFESIRIIMSGVDGFDYPAWLPAELEPCLERG
jgi:hypothetical protein